jgi:hypothetical protein
MIARHYRGRRLLTLFADTTAPTIGAYVEQNLLTLNPGPAPHGCACRDTQAYGQG